MIPLRIEQNSPPDAGASLIRSVLGIVLLGTSFYAYAADGSQSVDWLQVLLGLFGGLALFLGGLQSLSEGMTKAAGETMKVVLAKLTTNRFKGALTGAFITGVLNSSTVTTLLVVGFISGGMMTLTQSVGVIMGANIGSTVTAQLLAFDLAAYSLGPVAIGFFMLFTAKREQVKYYGMMIMGMGMVFYGMGLMSEAMTPLRSYQPFLDILKSLENPIAGIVAGALFTAVVQSSAATVGIAIAMASEGLLALPAGIALALGANIGTAITTALMGILSAKSVDALRASAVHVMFNVIGTVIWLPFIWLLVDMAISISPSSSELEGMARAASDVPRQIANANTLFNVINTLLFIGFTSWFARLAERLVPERPPTPGVIVEPKFLDEAALAVPSLALQQVRLELGRVGQITLGMLQDVVPALKNRDEHRLANIARRADEVSILEAEILRFLAKARAKSLTEHESQEFQGLMAASDNLENLANVVVTDIIGLAHKAANLNSVSGEKTLRMLGELYSDVVKSVEFTVQAVRDNDQLAAESVLMMKDGIRLQSDRLLARKAERLTPEDDDYLNLVRLEMAFVDQIRRIYTLAKRISKDVLPVAIAQHD